MEGEPKPEAGQLLRVELDEEYKYLQKLCSCGNEFRTAIPRKFFKHPDDLSLTLAVNGNERMPGYPDIKSADVQARIDQLECGDAERHPEA